MSRYVGRLSEWPWEHVRHVVLTVERDVFDGPGECWDSLRSDVVSAFVRELKRRLSLKRERGEVAPEVLDWVRILEWHKDGYPHWHLFFLVDIGGKRGRIGQDVIHAAWKRGIWVKEEYIRSEKHWFNVVGYGCKRGYIGKAKDHQVTLPAWALGRPAGSIRKLGGQKRVKAEQVGEQIGQQAEGDVGAAVEGEGAPTRERRSYHVVLSACGSKSVFVYEEPDGGKRIWILDAPFRRVLGVIRVLTVLKVLETFEERGRVFLRVVRGFFSGFVENIRAVIRRVVELLRFEDGKINEVVWAGSAV